MYMYIFKSIYLFFFLYSWQKAEKKLMDGAFSELKAEETEAEADEFGREMYKLFKVFNTKSKQMKKDRDVGGGVSHSKSTTLYVLYVLFSSFF